MEQIGIYDNGTLVSRVVIGDSLGLEPECDLGGCLKGYGHMFVVVDRQVALKSHMVYGLVDGMIRKGVPLKYLDVSEKSKTMESVLDICDWLLESGADRDALVLAVGGGITTDMTGFAASIYKRGVKFAYVPTTLLAQVDAAIGGKTGVNMDRYKNILGVIRQPEFTYICPQVLESLSQRDFLAGAAEMLKTFVIEDNGMYDRAVAFLEAYARSQESAFADGGLELMALIAAAAGVKAGVVSRDQFEGGERRVLNLGHTFAHAIETLSQRNAGDGDMPVLSIMKNDSGHMVHGEAVAVGLVLAARLSDSLRRSEKGLLDRLAEKDAGQQGLADRFEADLRACGLPVESPYQIKDMAEVMKKDKKAEGGKVLFVLPEAIGKVSIRPLTVDQVVKLMK